MPDAARRSSLPGKRLRSRFYLRFYLALLASLLAAAILFGLAHLGFDPAATRVATTGAHGHALGFIVLLVVIALVVAAGAYPVVRRLTGRLERLQRSVDAWGDGQLALRVAVEGEDEVARLASSFNNAGARIEALVAAQKSLLANVPMNCVRRSRASAWPPS